MVDSIHPTSGDIQQNLLALFQANKTCADCTAELTESQCLVSINFAVFLCTKCGQIHKKLGKQVSHVIPLSDPNLQAHPNICQILAEGGNEKNRELYEFHKPRWFLSPSSCGSKYVRENFIKKKYIFKNFIQTADDLKNFEAKKKEKLEELEIDSKAEELDLLEIREKSNIDRYWYYLTYDEGEDKLICKGAYNKRYILSLLKNGTLDENTFVWHPSRTTWETVDNIMIFKSEIKGGMTKENQGTMAAIADITKVQETPVRLLRGYLDKQDKRNDKNWQKRWVVMTNKNTLEYYKKNKATIPQGTISLQMCEIYVEGIVLKPGLCLVVEIKGLRRYNFWTENSDEIMEWAHELRRAKELYFKYMEAIPIQKQNIPDELTNVQSSASYTPPADMYGFLTKQGKGMFSGGRQKRYFELRDSTLTYYQTIPQPGQKTKMKGELNIETCKVKKETSPIPKLPFYFEIQSQKKVYKLWAESKAERDSWVSHLKKVSK